MISSLLHKLTTYLISDNKIIKMSINDFMLVIADGFRRLFLQFLPWFHYLIFVKLIGIDLVQIWIALVPKGTGSVPQSMEKRNWSRSKRNWDIPISDQIRSAFSHLHYLCFHRLMLHLLKSQTILDNQHINIKKKQYKDMFSLLSYKKLKYRNSIMTIILTQVSNLSYL